MGNSTSVYEPAKSTVACEGLQATVELPLETVAPDALTQ